MTCICPPTMFKQEEKEIPIAPSNFSDEELIKHIEHYYNLDDNLQELVKRFSLLHVEVLELRSDLEDLEDE